MKVILTEDVKSLGKKGEIVNVSDGYARNFILKKNKGVEANGKNLNDLKLKKANDDKIAQQQYEDAQELGGKIEAGKIEVAIKMWSWDAARVNIPWNLPSSIQRQKIPQIKS